MGQDGTPLRPWCSTSGACMILLRCRGQAGCPVPQPQVCSGGSGPCLCPSDLVPHRGQPQLWECSAVASGTSVRQRDPGPVSQASLPQGQQHWLQATTSNALWAAWWLFTLPLVLSCIVCAVVCAQQFSLAFASACLICMLLHPQVRCPQVRSQLPHFAAALLNTCAGPGALCWLGSACSF